MARPRHVGRRRHIRGSRFHVAGTASPRSRRRSSARGFARGLASRRGWNRSKARDFALNLLEFAVHRQDKWLLGRVLDSFFEPAP